MNKCEYLNFWNWKLNAEVGKFELSTNEILKWMNKINKWNDNNINGNNN